MGISYPPTLTVFGTAKDLMKTITLIGDIEQAWLKILAKVGARTYILFEGLNDGITTQRCTIKLRASDNRKFCFLSVQTY